MAQTKKIAVVLSGCGVFDGSEIHEAVLTLLSLDMHGAKIIFLAPNIPQKHVVNHANGEECKGEIRNVLTEASRIARGPVADLAKAKVKDYDAAIFPGGFGAVKNLCSFASDGARCDVNPAVAKFIEAMHAAGKPMGFACISPVLAAKVLGSSQVTVTVGCDKGTAAAIVEMGAKHVDTAGDKICVDTENKVVSTPAYMCEQPISKVARGIDEMVTAVIKLCS